MQLIVLSEKINIILNINLQSLIHFSFNKLKYEIN